MISSTCSSKPDLQVLCCPAVRSTSDSNEALNIYAAGLVNRRHCHSLANQLGPHRTLISDSFSKQKEDKTERKPSAQTKDKVVSPKIVGSM